ncbi:MAG: S8 family serine peptidase [Kiritimatiellia bacterium]
MDYTTDLAANMWTNPGEIPGNSVDDDGNSYVDDIYGYDFYNWDNNPMDDHGHGTHCSGTIGGVGNNGIGVAGVCWNVRIMAGKFIGASGYGYDSGAMAAVYSALPRKASPSPATPGAEAGTTSRSRIPSTPPTPPAFCSSRPPATAAPTTTPTRFIPAATSANIIAVTATTSTGSQVYNYGATTVDIGAPGASIYSTYPGGSYAYMSGTSMATPHVSGACALLKAARPDYTGAQLRSAILASAEPIASLTGKCVTGGRLNVRIAMEQAGIPTYPLSLAASAAGPNQVNLSWTDTAANETGFVVQRMTGQPGMVTDSSGGNHHGIGVGSPTWVNEGGGGFYNFYSNGNYVRIADADDLTSSGGLSVAIWVKPASVTSSRLVTKATSSSFAEWVVTYSSTGKLQFNAYDTTTSKYIAFISNDTFPADAGTWTHLAVTYDGVGTISFYHNGTLVAGTTSTGGGFVSVKNTVADITLGVFLRDSSPSYGLGSFDAFRLYGRALSGAEVSTLYSAGRSATRDAISNTSLAAFLDMDVPAPAWTALASPAANATTYNDTTVSADTDYHYRVRASNASGNSAWSNIASTRTSVAGLGELGAGSGEPGAEVGDGIAGSGEQGAGSGEGIRLTLSWADPVTPAAGAHSLTLDSPTSDLRPLTSAAPAPLLTWTSREGATYAIEFAPTLQEGFGLLHDGIPSTPPVNTFRLPADTPSGFFRILER